jgi:hypothetical protein
VKAQNDVKQEGRRKGEAVFFCWADDDGEKKSCVPFNGPLMGIPRNGGLDETD